MPEFREFVPRPPTREMVKPSTQIGSPKIDLGIEHRLKLQKEMNFTSFPGRHTKDSVIVGSRFGEAKTLIGKTIECPNLLNFEKALYKSDNIFLIPTEKQIEAEELAKTFFSNYVNKYKNNGATIDNVVEWVDTGIPGAASNKTRIYETENEWNTWTVHSAVENKGFVENQKYLPKYVTAYHELMHVEEIPKGAKESFEHQPTGELIPTVKTVLLLDEIYKKINNIPITEVANYPQRVSWGSNNQSTSLGELANFYRNLENKYGSIGKAMSSKESLKFINSKAA